MSASSHLCFRFFFFFATGRVEQTRVCSDLERLAPDVFPDQGDGSMDDLVGQQAQQVVELVNLVVVPAPQANTLID